MKRLFFIIVILTIIVKLVKCETALSLSGKTLRSLQCNRPHNLFRFTLAYQKAISVEIGISRFNYSKILKHGNKFDYYGSFEITPVLEPKKETNIIGLKAGYEFYMRRLVLAIEPKYLTDGNNYNLLITPKVGLDFGRFILFYGYNISAIGAQFSRVGNNQFSVVIHFRSKLFF